MQPNKYQKIVLNDLRSFLLRWVDCNDPAEAFRAHWEEKGVSRMPNYQRQSHGVAQVCAKVPTAGGKTLIGIYSLQEAFNVMSKRSGEPRLCVWLVPSLSIKDQVIKRFSTAGDGYWLALREALGNKVTVLSKEQLLAGEGQFNADIVREEVVIAVLTYDSLRSNFKDSRKLYQPNGGLASFALDVAGIEPVKDIDSESVVAAIASLNPIVIVDESHNAKSDLSCDMLASLNPCCVIELTATPRKDTSIISFVDAMALRDEHMVKLPVVVRNLPNQNSVIAHAIDLRKRLEAEALAEHANGGEYIRPIVLFQAEPRNKNISFDYEKLRKELADGYGIHEDWIKIKTADVDELKGIDLMASNCDVRFVITVNALKEGWDCPFAYILATLADRSSSVDVEQILGRILRQPYIRKHGHKPLNMSYVLTASSVFSQTLEQIVKGLNHAGFSRNDYRTPDSAPNVPSQPAPSSEGIVGAEGTTDLFSHADSQQDMPPALATTDIESGAHTVSVENGEVTLPSTEMVDAFSVDSTLQCGVAADTQLDYVASKTEGEYIAPEQREMMNSFRLRQDFAEEISNVRLPQFFRRVSEDSLFAEVDGGALLDRDMLLERFRLVDCDVNDFKPNLSASGDMAQIDLKKLSSDGIADYEPTRINLKPPEMKKIRDYLATLSPDSKRKQLVGLIGGWLGKMPPLGETDLLAYINKLLDRMTAAELEDIVEQQHVFIDAVKDRVRLEMANYRKKTFEQWVRNNEVFANEYFEFPKEQHPIELYPPTENTLYEREERAKITGLEREMSDWLASSSNIVWWHRNHQNRGFSLNGSINHYPDFIARTERGTLVLIETKGQHLKNDESKTKVELGKLWQECVGRDYRYIMVFVHKPLEGALSWQEAIDMLQKV